MNVYSKKNKMTFREMYYVLMARLTSRNRTRDLERDHLLQYV